MAPGKEVFLLIPDKTDMVKGTVHVIGIPPGRREPSDWEALSLLEKAELVVANRELSPLQARKGREVLTLEGDLAQIIARLKRVVAEGKEAAVLATGDPHFYGIASRLAKELGKDSIRVYPAVTSMQLAFSRIGESWEDALLLSAHSRPLESVAERLRWCHKACILTSDGRQPAQLANMLLSKGVDDFSVYVFERLGFPEERVHCLDLARTAEMRFAPLNLLILIKKCGERTVHADEPLHCPDEIIARKPGRENKITKFEIRALALAKLMLKPGDTLWDIGAGTGALSLDASRWLSRGRVYAIERDAESLEVIRENTARCGALNVYAVEACAPELPRHVPDPDAVFIGGSGGLLKEILTMCVRRLRPGGRLVCSIVDLRRASEAKDHLEKLGLLPELVMAQIYRGSTGGDINRLEPLNPVFLVSATRKEENER
jgi:precorrin-6Y C5,15-methyltransferase (decarboxylating)